MFVFLAFHKSGVIKSCSASEDLSAYKISWPHADGESFTSTSEVSTSTILEWLKLHDYKLWCQGYIQWLDLLTEYHTNLPIGTKVHRGDTHRQEGDLISLLFPPFRKESRLKRAKNSWKVTCCISGTWLYPKMFELTY
jgi:hypothetical protein